MADEKISLLTELTAPDDADLLAIVDDPAGTPVTKKITKANLLASLGLELDYVEFTANVDPTATTEGTANIVVTGNSVAYDGSTPVMIEFRADNARPDLSAVDRTMTFWLYEDGSSIGKIGLMSPGSGDKGANSPVHLSRRITPTNASHIYSIRASVSAGTGLVSGGAGGAGNSSPGFIRITKANP